jgi:hypothetical protein
MVNSQMWVPVYFEVIVTPPPLPATGTNPLISMNSHSCFILLSQIVQMQYYWDSADELLSLPLYCTLIRSLRAGIIIILSAVYFHLEIIFNKCRKYWL